MTAFVRLSNKKHLQHASRHAELHFSDGLCIMAHSPKAFLLTFHLLVRKSHYQHKMNFLKLEAYPLLARIRQLLPVLGQCLMYFIAAVFLLVASNLKTVESTLSQIRRRRARGTSGLWPSSP